MDVFPELLGEKEFLLFEPDDYGNLSRVINDTLAGYLLNYIANPGANPAVVESINKYLGSTINKLTMHTKLQEMGVVDLVTSVAPDQLLSSGYDLDEVIEKLTFLEEHYDEVMFTVPARTKADYEAFMTTMRRIVTKGEASAEGLTYPDVLDRIRDNSFLFYKSNEKSHNTHVNALNSRKRQWTIVLNGARYTKRCEQEGISMLDRRRF